MPHPDSPRCAFCRHRLRANDPDLAPVRVFRIPPSRGGSPRPERITACTLCATSKGPLTEAEYRSVMGHPERLKNWVRLILGAMQAEKSERAS